MKIQISQYRLLLSSPEKSEESKEANVTLCYATSAKASIL